MDELYRSYLGFLRSLSRGLESLTDLNEKKLAAAQQDDLMGLNELLNQEQAQALNFRGLELTRDKLLSQLGLVGVPMSVISDRFPPAMQAEARQAVEELQSRYAAYQKASGETRHCWSRTCTKGRRSSCSWGDLPPGARGDLAMARSQRAARRPRP